MNTEKQQLDAQLTEVLKHLPGWKLDPAYARHTWCAVLVDGEGRGIHVNATQAKGRLYLSGIWPQTSDREYCRPDKCLHITVGRDRPPEKTAAEITRRFLPWYLAAYTEETERVRQHNESRNRQQELTVELTALLGPDAHKRLQTGRCQIHAPGLSVDVHGNGDVSNEMRYRNVKVATAVLKAYVKAGGLTE